MCRYWDVNPSYMVSTVNRAKTDAASATLAYRPHVEGGVLQLVEEHTDATARHLSGAAPAAPPVAGPTLFLSPLGAESRAAVCGHDVDMTRFFGANVVPGSGPVGSEMNEGSPELARERAERRALPEAVAAGACTNSSEVGVGDAGLVLQANVTLRPGESRTLYFAFGYFYGSEAPQLPEFPAAAMERSLEQWRAWLPKVSVPRSSIPSLGREMAWHAYYTRTLSMYEAYLDRHTLTQGFAYLFLMGDHAVSRDTLQAVLPMIYFNPSQARDTLESVLMQATPDGEAPYAITGDHLRTWHIWYPST